MKFDKENLSYATPVVISLLAPLPYSLITGANISNATSYMHFSILFYLANVIMIFLLPSFAGSVFKAQEITEGSEHYWMVGFIEKKAQEVGLKKAPKVLIKDDENPNACALGYRSNSVIIVNSSLMAFSNNCVEGILAHELAHIELGHTFTINFINNFLEFPKLILSLYLFIARGVFTLMGTVIPFAGTIGSVAVSVYEIFLNLYVNVLSAIVGIIFNFLNRHQEKEADIRAIQTIKHLGILEYFEWANQFKMERLVNINFDTHPDTETRISYCLNEARSLGIFNGNELTSGI